MLLRTRYPSYFAASESLLHTPFPRLLRWGCPGGRNWPGTRSRRRRRSFLPEPSWFLLGNCVMATEKNYPACMVWARLIQKKLRHALHHHGGSVWDVSVKPTKQFRKQTFTKKRVWYMRGNSARQPATQHQPRQTALEATIVGQQVQPRTALRPLT